MALKGLDLNSWLELEAMLDLTEKHDKEAAKPKQKQFFIRVMAYAAHVMNN